MVEPRPRVLVVDGDRSSSKVLRTQLDEEGFTALPAWSGDEAFRISDSDPPNLAVVDVRLPDKSGLDVLGYMTERHRIPVILLAELASTQEKIDGFAAGADDFVTKPYNPDELVARIRAILRRHMMSSRDQERGRIKVGDVLVDLGARLVIRDGAIVPLSRTEWKLFELLVQQRGRVLSSDEILSRAWGPRFVGQPRYLSVWMSRLRHKLEPDREVGSLIRTYPGAGYLLQD